MQRGWKTIVVLDEETCIIRSSKSPNKTQPSSSLFSRRVDHVGQALKAIEVNWINRKVTLERVGRE